MAGGCGASCAKVILIIFNVIFLLTGLALLAVGIWMAVSPDSLLAKIDQISSIVDADSYMKYAAYILIAAGVFVIIVSVFGCCGAIQESVCLLSVYIFLLVLVMAIELAGGVLAIIFRQQIVEVLEKASYCNFKAVGAPGCDNVATTDSWKKAFRFVQHEFKCCGVHNYTDYNLEHSIHPNAYKLSWSCCTKKAGETNFLDVEPYFTNDESFSGQNGLGESEVKSKFFKDYDNCLDHTGTDTFYSRGCKPAIEEWLQLYAPILIGLGIGIASFELFVIIFAVCLCRNTSDKDE